MPPASVWEFSQWGMQFVFYQAWATEISACFYVLMDTKTRQMLELGTIQKV